MSDCQWCSNDEDKKLSCDDCLQTMMNGTNNLDIALRSAVKYFFLVWGQNEEMMDRISVQEMHRIIKRMEEEDEFDSVKRKT